jgi:hypothetical protein
MILDAECHVEIDRVPPNAACGERDRHRVSLIIQGPCFSTYFSFEKSGGGREEIDVDRNHSRQIFDRTPGQSVYPCIRQGAEILCSNSSDDALCSRYEY